MDNDKERSGYIESSKQKPRWRRSTEALHRAGTGLSHVSSSCTRLALLIKAYDCHTWSVPVYGIPVQTRQYS